MPIASDKQRIPLWRWLWLIFVLIFTYAGYSMVFDSRNPVQWLVSISLLFKQQLWAPQLASGLIAGYLHFRGLLWAWRMVSPREQTPLRFFGGLLGGLILGMLLNFVHDEAASFHEHLLAGGTISPGILAVVWYLTLITSVTCKTANAHIRLLSLSREETVSNETDYQVNK
ncbi:MAG: hypothetical protein JW892_03470 [Anaerolineae bacterium]|nr:hypothetical protein [Anaerolineae bacterium]